MRLNVNGFKPTRLAIFWKVNIMNRFKLQCLHADTCRSGYWSGHRLANICVQVWRNMTIVELRNALRNELRQGAVAGSDDVARFLSADIVRPEEEKRADMVTRAAYAAITRDVRMKKRGSRFPFPDLPEDSEEDVDFPLYAYFVFREF